MSSVFIVNFEQISHIFFGVPIVDFVQANADWVLVLSQLTFTSSKSTVEILAKDVFTVNNKNTRTMSLTSLWCFYC